MVKQRLTLLPVAEEQVATVVPARVEAPATVREQVEVTSISKLSQGGRWRTEASRSYDRPCLIWFTRGQGRITVAGRSGGYGAHSAIFLPAGTMHSFSATASVLGSLVWLDHSKSDHWPNETQHLRIREVHRQRELTGLIENIEREGMSDAAHAKEAVEHHAGLLAIWFDRICSELAAVAEAKPYESAAHRLTQAYTALIEQDFTDTVGVQHFAKKLGVTPTHLSRACREASGKAALEILSERRHFEACRLLKDTKLPVSTVARRTGFASSAYFTRAFRARAGQSPTQFRTNR
ncbi:MAG: AraC family transcriptional regulator [Boseongicola sp.]|nr:AraC family transcriptional regulator [Boseongicola sp.]